MPTLQGEGLVLGIPAGLRAGECVHQRPLPSVASVYLVFTLPQVHVKVHLSVSAHLCAGLCHVQLGVCARVRVWRVYTRLCVPLYRPHHCAGVGAVHVCVYCTVGDSAAQGFHAPCAESRPPAPLWFASGAQLVSPHPSLSLSFLPCKTGALSSTRALRRGDEGFVSRATREAEEGPREGPERLDPHPGTLRRWGLPRCSGAQAALLHRTSQAWPRSYSDQDKASPDPPGRIPGRRTRESTWTKAKTSW